MHCRTLIAVLVAAVTLAGCEALPKRVLSKELPAYVSLPNGNNPLNPSQTLPALAKAGGDLALGAQWEGREINVLMLSGGGRNGAFGAGVLVGWAQTGERPRFDIVTGVSTGGLQSTFAFLGTPADDRILAEVFTGVTNDDIHVGQSTLRTLFGSSFRDSSPLARLIEKHITEEVLERVAAEADKGRILVVGTTNLDYRQLWMWNLTLLAREGGPHALDIFRKVILASASPPGVFPPVEIFGHLFSDGAVINNLLIIGQSDTSGALMESGRLPTGNLYVIHNGRTGVSPDAVSPGIRFLVSRGVELALEAQMYSSLLRSYAVATLHGLAFHLMQIPGDVELGGNAMDFDQAQMQYLYDVGRELGAGGAWLDAPPASPEVRSWFIESVRRLAPAR